MASMKSVRTDPPRPYDSAVRQRGETPPPPRRMPESTAQEK